MVVPTGLLKFVDLFTVIGTTEVLTLSCLKSMDMMGGSSKVAYVDHEDNDDDFADKLSDMDNFYIGYLITFKRNAHNKKAHLGVLLIPK